MSQASRNTVQLDRAELRRALGSFLTGVTILTAHDADGHPRGITANSFTSVSLDPPLVLVCVDRIAASYQTFAECTGFAIHVLAADQQELSATFAGKRPDKFAGLTTSIGLGGAPILPACAAVLDCRTDRQIDVGDHVLVIGEVLDFTVTEHRPLGYHQGQYVTLTPEQLVLDALDHATNAEVPAAGTSPAGAPLSIIWIAESSDGAVVMCDSDADWKLPRTESRYDRLGDDALTAAAASCLGARTEVGFLYSVYDDASTAALQLAYRVRAHATAAQICAARPNLTCFAADKLPWNAIHDPALSAMLQRYVRERAGAQFGLYAGSAESGRVATLAAIDND